MTLRTFLALLFCGIAVALAGCSTHSTDTADRLVQQTADGLGPKHPSRIALERELAEQESDPKEREREAGTALALELARERSELLDSGLGEKHPKVVEIGRKIDRLRVYRSGQSRHQPTD